MIVISQQVCFVVTKSPTPSIISSIFSPRIFGSNSGAKISHQIVAPLFCVFFQSFSVGWEGEGKFCVSLSPMHVWHASWGEGFTSWIWRNLLLIVKYVVVVVGALGLRILLFLSFFKCFDG